MTGTPRQLALAALGGVAYGFGFVGYDVWPLIFVFLVPTLVATREASPRRALVLGWITGLVANLICYSWVVHLIEEFAGLPTPLAVLGYVLLCLFQGGLVGVVFYLVGRAREGLGVAPGWALLAAFPAVEFTYPLLFPSFIGNALYGVPVLTQGVELTGMLGLTALIVLVNGALFELVLYRVERRRIAWRPIAAGAVALSLTLAFGLARLPQLDRRIEAARKLKVALIQTNLGARDKHLRRDEFIERHQAMTREALARDPDLSLIVWPESAFNSALPKGIANVKRAVLEGIEAPVIFGAITVDRGPAGERRIYNTALLAGADGTVLGTFDKMELLAFGETIPLVDTFPAIKELLPMSGTFTRGTTVEHLRLGGTDLLPMICYEDIIPSFVRRIWRGAGPADALVNVTNDSWYGDTHEPLIHLALATFRSIETRRALIRSTNTGISALVDPAGRIVKRSGQWTQETVIGEVPLFEDGESTLYMRIGDVIGWAGLAAVLLGALRIRRARPRRG
jgi:apolipoprotein N-acyltransferase